MSRVTPVKGIAKPLPDVKGAADEGRTQRTLPGQTDKIRLTVAVAESYELIVGFTPNGMNSDDFPGRCNCFGRVSFIPRVAVEEFLCSGVTI